MNSTWLITSELVNQRARKVLFTCVVCTKYIYYPTVEVKKFIDERRRVWKTLRPPVRQTGVLLNNCTLLYSWSFSLYSAPTHWLVHGHMTSNNETVSKPNALSGQRCENYDVKRESVYCYPRNVDRCSNWSEMAWCCPENLSAFFKNCFCFVLLYNKALNHWSLEEKWILFPSYLNVSLDLVSGNIEILGKRNWLFPSGPVIKC